MAEQVAMFKEDDLDPAITKIADRLIDLHTERKTVKENYEIQEQNLMGMLKKAGLKQIRHGGRIIKIDHKDESENIKITEDKGVKTGTRHPVEGKKGAPNAAAKKKRPKKK